MARGTTDKNSRSAQRDFVDGIVREVIARLSANQSSGNNSAATTIGDRVVTAETVNAVKGTPQQIFVIKGAVVTPAARDEARRRGITINACGVLPSAQPSGTCDANNKPTIEGITDDENPQRAEAIAQQLVRRGINRLTARVVMSERPAAEVHRLCRLDDQRAVMITSLADVDRFAAELDPTVWVIDMLRMNLMTTVNVIARIQQRTAAET